ncbi:MAG: beta-ketoacyl-ACP synthase III [Bryobacterales bacterium]|nr:beta-ketoacyl-ACP synthase III [Bryobacterales bacterium]
MRGAKISALGCYVPPRVLTNQDFEQIVETTNEWILERTGIRERHIAEPNVATSDLAVEAARKALDSVGLSPSDLDAILVCTVTPDMMFPATACLVQHKLGAKAVWGFDLLAACCSFLYGLNTAADLVRAGTHNRIMVIGADTMSRIVDYTDRATCVLFGDGAGAMIVEATDDPSEGLQHYFHEVDGSGGEHLKMPAGGSRMPASHETIDQRLHYVKQDGQQVFRFAVKRLYDVATEVLQRAGLTPADLKLLIPHQANQRIISATAERLGLRPDQVVINIEKYGNTTGATIPLATMDAVQDGRLKKGDLVLFAAVGAGFTTGATLWRWSY